MPAKPRWHADLDKIRAAAEALKAPFLDRPAIERLFGVKARQANKLMRRLGGYRLGNADLVGREDLLARLDGLAGPDGYQGQVTRRARVLEALDEVRGQARPRRVSAPPPRRQDAALPEGARLTGPGELTISCTSAEDLLGRVMGLAQAASENFAAFEAGLLPFPAPDSPDPDSVPGDLR